MADTPARPDDEEAGANAALLTPEEHALATQLNLDLAAASKAGDKAKVREIEVRLKQIDPFNQAVFGYGQTAGTFLDPRQTLSETEVEATRKRLTYGTAAERAAAQSSFSQPQLSALAQQLKALEPEFTDADLLAMDDNEIAANIKIRQPVQEQTKSVGLHSFLSADKPLSIKQLSKLSGLPADQVGMDLKPLLEAGHIESKVIRGNVTYRSTQQFFTGGEIQGEGGPTDDAETIKASPGEFVEQASAVSREGPAKMEALNEGQAHIVGNAPGFSHGGLLGRARPGVLRGAGMGPEQQGPPGPRPLMGGPPRRPPAPPPVATMPEPEEPTPPSTSTDPTVAAHDRAAAERLQRYAAEHKAQQAAARAAQQAAIPAQRPPRTVAQDAMSALYGVVPLPLAPTPPIPASTLAQGLYGTQPPQPMAHAIPLGPQQDPALLSRTQKIYSELTAKSDQQRALTAQAAGTPYQPLNQQQQQALYAQAAGRALQEFEAKTRLAGAGLDAFGRRAITIAGGLIRGGAAGVMGAAGSIPALSQTVGGSVGLVRGEIGIILAPTLLNLASGLQGLSRRLQSISPEGRSGLNTLAVSALAMGGGMRLGGMLGMGSAAGLGIGLLSMGLMRSGQQGGQGLGAVEKTAEQLAVTFGHLMKALDPAIVGLGRLTEAALRMGGGALQFVDKIGSVAGPSGGGMLLTALTGAAIGSWMTRSSVGRGSSSAALAAFEGAGSGSGNRFGGFFGTRRGMLAGAGLAVGAELAGSADERHGPTWQGNIGWTAMGASIGSAIAPGFGTAIGAVIGHGAHLLSHRMGWIGGAAAPSEGGLTRPEGVTQQQWSQFMAVGTGFQSRSGGLEGLHEMLQQEAVRDPMQQANFEQQMRVLQQIEQHLRPGASVPGAPTGLRFD
jgi:hypothetical protein